MDDTLRGVKRESLGLKGTVFVYIGRIWRKKGLDTLLNAYKDLVAEHQGEASLLIVGDGEDEAWYRQRCAEEEIPDVVFAGFVQKDELPSYLALADVAVFPTLGDPYGLVVDEALAASLPVISSDAAGEIRPRIQDYKNGFIVPAADGRALLKRMTYFATHPHELADMSVAALPSTAMRTPEMWAREFASAVRAVAASSL